MLQGRIGSEPLCLHGDDGTLAQQGSSGVIRETLREREGGGMVDSQGRERTVVRKGGTGEIKRRSTERKEMGGTKKE